jgi:hypothetical protein
MDDALRVGGVQRIDDLNPLFQHLLRRKRSPADEMLQRLTIQKLHNDELPAFVFANLVNGAEIRMVRRNSSLCLALEAFQGLMVPGRIFRATKRWRRVSSAL